MNSVSVVIAAILLVGCSSHISDMTLDRTTPTNADTFTDTSTVTVKELSALDILQKAGLMTKQEYTDAHFIPDSRNTMIVADVRDAPCRMIFQFISTESGSYWMPNQISCTG